MCLFTKGELVMRKLKQIWHKIKAIPFIGDNYEKLVGQKKIERKMHHYIGVKIIDFYVSL